MGGFVLDSNIENDSILVNSKFISRYMIHANGEFVKVYLMLLYYSADKGSELSLESLGDSLEQSEKAIVRALKYWEQMNLLALKYNKDNNICGVTIKGFPDDLSRQGTEAALSGEESLTSVETEGLKPDGSTVALRVCPDRKPDLKKISNDEDYGALLVAVQKYLGTTLSKTGADSFAYMYDVLGLPLEVIEYIVELCVNEGHKSIRYMEAVARSWFGRGIVTLEQAKAEGVVYNKDVYTVMKALGLGGRNPSPDERADIDRWLREYGFDVVIVTEACRRTMDRLHSADFHYVEGILKEWKKKDVKSMSDIKYLDEVHKTEVKLYDGKSRADARTKTPKNNKFHNFEQRNTNYDDMMIDINEY